MTEPMAAPSAAEGEGCRRAGCGFALGVIGSALVTVGVLLFVVTRGHPLSAIAGLLGATQTPTSTSQAVPALTASPPAVTPAPTSTARSSATPVPTRTPSPTPTPTPTPIIVLSEVNSLGRYETLEFLIQTVVDLERDPDTFWERVCGSDKLLLVAGGEVHAGFDLAKVRPGDLRVDGRSVSLLLPPVEVFEYFVKEDQTQVYQRTTGLLCRPDPNLETEARRMAEERLLDYAFKQGILERAEKAGLTQLEGLLRSLGFEQVNLKVQSAD
ncbi:MAG: DUF4230 domain-containing protein [Anaerolineae bacterium]|jgi:hypothetical protein|nr:DUF4230 domain-containing protein [Anaerolineae bacterium]